MRQLIFHFLMRWFAPQFEIHDANVREAYAEERELARRQAELMEMQTLVYKPVICFSNEYDNPVVGFVKEIQLITKAQCPVFVVMDHISGQELMILGQTFEYTYGLYQMAFTADRMRINELLYKTASRKTYKMPEEKLLTLEQAQKRLASTGFFNLVERCWALERASREVGNLAAEFQADVKVHQDYIKTVIEGLGAINQTLQGMSARVTTTVKS